MAAPRCPTCGGEAFLVSPGYSVSAQDALAYLQAGIDPPSSPPVWGCCCGGVRKTWSDGSAASTAAGEEARALSRANAGRYGR